MNLTHTYVNEGFLSRATTTPTRTKVSTEAAVLIQYVCVLHSSREDRGRSRLDDRKSQLVSFHLYLFLPLYLSVCRLSILIDITIVQSNTSSHALCILNVYQLTPERNCILQGFFRKLLRRDSWTFRSDIHEIWASTSDRFHALGNNLSRWAWTVPEPVEWMDKWK